MKSRIESKEFISLTYIGKFSLLTIFHNYLFFYFYLINKLRKRLL